MTKTYNTRQLVKIMGVEYDTLQKQLARDAKKPFEKRKFKSARKCECGHSWFVSLIEITTNFKKRNITANNVQKSSKKRSDKYAISKS